jgi:hypothetical protein
MSALAERLYPMPDLRRTPLSTLRWWESRRPFYNAVVGTAGLVTLAVTVVTSGPQVLMGPALIGVAVYAAAANLFYTSGWGIELVARLLWGRRAPLMGPALFRQGLIFSVGLTLLPALVMTLLFIVRLVLLVLGVDGVSLW